MNEDGTMARRPELERFAQKHGLPMGTIADLIAYRSLHEQSVELTTRKTVGTEHGDFVLHVFRDLIDDTLHYALTRGELTPAAPTLVRVQSLELLRDVFETRLDDRTGWSVRRVLAHIAREDRGALVLIGQERSVAATLADIDAFPETARGAEGGDGIANYRIIGTGAQILQQLNVGRMRLMSAPLRFNALSGFNLEVTDFVQPG
jgi:3,4-dihydroxy 2-butanone 4-phosphate synthase/GTP cyclohydrolase II